MSHLRLFVLFIALVMIAYTIVAIRQDGLDFMTPYLIGVISLDWQGHINTDFTFYLLMSALWIAWREGFSPMAFALAGMIGLMGMVLFAPYLLRAIAQSGGNPQRLLLGKNSS